MAPVGWAAGAGAGTGARATAATAAAAAAAAARTAREAGQRLHPGAHVAAGFGGGSGQGRRGHVWVVKAAHRRRRRGLGGHRGPRGGEHGRFGGKTTRGELGGGSGRAVGHTCGPALRARPWRSEAPGEHLVALMAYERVRPMNIKLLFYHILNFFSFSPKNVFNQKKGIALADIAIHFHWSKA